MLAETLSSSNVDAEDRPRKRRRVRQPRDDPSKNSALSYAHRGESHDDDDMSIEFEDVMAKPEQTAYNDSEEGSPEDDLAWEEVGITDFALRLSEGEEDDGDLHLTLAAEKSPQRIATGPRRKALSKAERALRLDIHKMHILCLLSHVDRRNNWCNDSEVQKALKSLLTKQMTEYLKPKDGYTQFGRAESVKKGLTLVTKMWESKFTISAKGMQRPYWAESEQEIRDVGGGPL
jgi:xeroderma pigmentosum group C-complementing protein